MNLCKIRACVHTLSAYAKWRLLGMWCLLLVGSLSLIGSLVLPVWAAFFPLVLRGASQQMPRIFQPPILPAGGQYRVLSDRLQVQGQSMAAWLFEVPGSVPALATWLTQHQPALRDLWVMPGSAVLAGIEGSTQWAARLFETNSGTTRGTLSAMRLNKEPFIPRLPSLGNSLNQYESSAGFLQGRSHTPLNWQLKGGHLQFTLQFYEGSDRVTQQVWRHPLPPAMLWKFIKQDFAATDWHAVSGQIEQVGEGKWLEQEKRVEQRNQVEQEKRLEQGRRLEQEKRIEQGKQIGQLGDEIAETPAWSTWLKANTSLSMVITALETGSGVTTILCDKAG